MVAMVVAIHHALAGTGGFDPERYLRELPVPRARPAARWLDAGQDIDQLSVATAARTGHSWRMAYDAPKDERDASRHEAVALMLRALSILDRCDPLAASTLSLAVEQAGGHAPEPCEGNGDQDRDCTESVAVPTSSDA